MIRCAPRHFAPFAPFPEQFTVQDGEQVGIRKLKEMAQQTRHSTESRADADLHDHGLQQTDRSPVHSTVSNPYLEMRVTHPHLGQVIRSQSSRQWL